MGTITWEPAQRRLRMAGTCTDADRAAVAEALEAAEDPDAVLIIDLVAVASLAPSVAEVIAAAWQRSGERRVSVLRRRDTEVDDVLRKLGV